MQTEADTLKITENRDADGEILPTATLTKEDEDTIEEVIALARSGEIKTARKTLLPILESICEQGLEAPPEIERAYAEITILESLQKKADPVIQTHHPE